MTVLSNAPERTPRQRYVWPEKALSLVRPTRIPKKDGAAVVKQLQELTNYSEKLLAAEERYGFLRPHHRRPWSQEDIARILKMCESDRSVAEIAEEFGTTVRTIHLKIIRNGKRAERNGSTTPFPLSQPCCGLREPP